MCFFLVLVEGFFWGWRGLGLFFRFFVFLHIQADFLVNIVLCMQLAEIVLISNIKQQSTTLYLESIIQNQNSNPLQYWTKCMPFKGNGKTFKKKKSVSNLFKSGDSSTVSKKNPLQYWTKCTHFKGNGKHLKKNNLHQIYLEMELLQLSLILSILRVKWLIPEKNT